MGEGLSRGLHFAGLRIVGGIAHGLLVENQQRSNLSIVSVTPTEEGLLHGKGYP